MNTVFSEIKSALVSGESVKISGFGVLAPRHKRARKGRDPQTGEEIEIPARRVVTFKVSPVLRKKMNREP